MSSDVTYKSYLQLDKLLSTQHPISDAHDEMMFIAVHQVYEVWFKLVLFELDRVQQIFSSERVRDQELRVVSSSLGRIVAVIRHVVGQLDIMETMTPLDFLDFRHVFRSASGFQSMQFREIEVRLGLLSEDRIGYAGKSFETYLDSEDQAQLRELSSEKSLIDQLDDWLARTPFVEMGDFRFWEAYRQAVSDMIETDRATIRGDAKLNEQAKEMELGKLDRTEEQFAMLFTEESGLDWRLSNRALQAALFINLYRDQPALQLPFKILNDLMDLDELLALWRYRHALMAQRMLGTKMGSGGSSGHDYLAATAAKHRIFKDLFAVSTFLISRSKLPELPAEVARKMSFNYWGASDAS